MMRTDAEVKNLWCPMAHKRIYAILSADEPNRLEEAHEQTRAANCIGSQCAMWRENSRRKSDDLIVSKRIGGDPDRFEAVGYCGLAGRPQE